MQIGLSWCTRERAEHIFISRYSNDDDDEDDDNAVLM